MIVRVEMRDVQYSSTLRILIQLYAHQKNPIDITRILWRNLGDVLVLRCGVSCSSRYIPKCNKTFQFVKCWIYKGIRKCSQVSCFDEMDIYTKIKIRSTPNKIIIKEFSEFENYLIIQISETYAHSEISDDRNILKLKYMLCLKFPTYW
jgi:hypothetical protein